MGSGDRAYRMALGEALAIQEHQLAMIPIMQEQAEMELGVKEKVFELELEQTKQLSLLAQQLQPEPIFVAADVTETKPEASKYLVYAGFAALAYFFLR